jgi:hypothetical protein
VATDAMVGFAAKSRAFWGWVLVGIIAAGLLSRTLHSGSVIVDKYLGDALYAAMVYAIVRLVWIAVPAMRVAIWAMSVMTAIELFQLTLIPAHLLRSGHLLVRISARLMGTEFSFRDLVAYAVGIACVYWVDRFEGVPRGRGVRRRGEWC